MSDERRNKKELLKELIGLLEDSAHDEKSTKDEEYASGLFRAHNQIVNRNILLTKLLESYIDSHSKKVSENRLYKRIMFFVFLGVFVVFSGATLWMFLKTDFSNADVPQVIALLSIGATYIGSIFVAYEIMFKYLFPTDEEKDMISMIKTVIENDLKVEEFTSLRLTGSETKRLENSEQDNDD